MSKPEKSSAQLWPEKDAASRSYADIRDTIKVRDIFEQVSVDAYGVIRAPALSLEDVHLVQKAFEIDMKARHDRQK